MLLLVSCFTLLSRETEKSPGIRIVFYNVENLFDIYNDPSVADEEFLPHGLMRWNSTRYRNKINAVYKTIIAAGEWNPPEIVAFSEIENRKVLEDLVYGTNLSRFQYGIIHEDSPDPRGIDVCMIFRKDMVKILEQRSLIPASVKRTDFHTRSVLYVKSLVYGDTLHFLVNHWPSRRGGVLAGEELRQKIAEMVRSVADSIGMKNNGKAKIIILGDFNCGPENQIMQTLVSPVNLSPGTTSQKLVNLAAKGRKGFGTYRYQGSWETLDQIIISEEVLNCSKGLTASEDGFTIFRPDFLLVRDPAYPGLSPYSTYRGYRYQGGFSDHLPVMIDLYSR